MPSVNAVYLFDVTLHQKPAAAEWNIAHWFIYLFIHLSFPLAAVKCVHHCRTKKKKAYSTCHLRWRGAYFQKSGMAVSVRVLFWCSMTGPRHSAAHGGPYRRFSVIIEWQAECKPLRCINLIEIYQTRPWCMCQISKIRVILFRIHYLIWKRTAGSRQHKARCDIQLPPGRQTQRVENRHCKEMDACLLGLDVSHKRGVIGGSNNVMHPCNPCNACRNWRETAQ